MVHSNIVTATKPSLDIGEEILSLLKVSPMPLTATDLRVKLRVLSLKLPEYGILRELRFPREEGMVRLEGGSWKAISPFVKKPVIQQTTLSKARSRPKILKVPPTDEWAPSKSTFFSAIILPKSLDS